MPTMPSEGPPSMPPNPVAVEAVPQHLVHPSSLLNLGPPARALVCFGKVPGLLLGKEFSLPQPESEVVSQVLS